jgi:hypothetical protein
MLATTADAEVLDDGRALGCVCSSDLTASCGSFSGSNKGAMMKDQPR